MTFTKQQIADVCRAWGIHLHVDDTINGPRLLWALSGCESSFGLNATPRHEPAYDAGGAYAANAEMAKLLAEFGSAAACSYGPWQILLVNCQPGTSPDDMLRAERCAMETVSFINRVILDHEHARTVKEIAEAYNSGKWRWQEVPPGVERYADDCLSYYLQYPMPAASVSAEQATQ